MQEQRSVGKGYTCLKAPLPRTSLYCKVRNKKDYNGETKWLEKENKTKKNRLVHSDQWDQSLRTLPRSFPRLLSFLRVKNRGFLERGESLVKEDLRTSLGTYSKAQLIIKHYLAVSEY